MNNQSYVEKKEEDQDAFGNGLPFGAPNPAKPMIEISATNRILISDRQAQLLTLIELHHLVLSVKCRSLLGRGLFKRIGEVNYASVQAAQLTRDSMSREDYIKVAVGTKKKKGIFDIFSRKQASSEAGESDSGND